MAYPISFFGLNSHKETWTERWLRHTRIHDAAEEHYERTPDPHADCMICGQPSRDVPNNLRACCNWRGLGQVYTDGGTPCPAWFCEIHFSPSETERWDSRRTGQWTYRYQTAAGLEAEGWRFYCKRHKPIWLHVDPVYVRTFDLALRPPLPAPPQPRDQGTRPVTPMGPNDFDDLD